MICLTFTPHFARMNLLILDLMVFAIIDLLSYGLFHLFSSYFLNVM